MDPLHAELSHHQYLKDRLKADFPEADEETLADTLEGMTDLTAMLAEVVRSIMEDTAMSASLDKRIQDMLARKTRLTRRANQKRELLVTVMDRASINKITEPDFTLSLRATPRPLVVTDWTTIPAKWLKYHDPTVDRASVIAALKNGDEVLGATLGNGGRTVSIRTK